MNDFQAIETCLEDVVRDRGRSHSWVFGLQLREIPRMDEEQVPKSTIMDRLAFQSEYACLRHREQLGAQKST